MENDDKNKDLLLTRRSEDATRNRDLWEMLNNSNFNPHTYGRGKNESAKPLQKFKILFL